MTKKPEDQQTLGQKVVAGGGWLLALKVFHRGMGFIRTIILARLLSPEDFGLFGIALLFFNFLENFSVTGINTALVQKREDISGYLDSAWTFNLIRSGILFSIIFFGAPVIAGFFNSPDATGIIRAMAFLQLLLGLENIGAMQFQKELDFNKVACLKASETLSTVMVSIVLAFWVRNAWALVFGSLAGYFTRLFMSYLLHPYRPRLTFDYTKIRELMGFGKWIFGSSILVYLITQGDDIFVGKMMGAAALGLYQMAYLLSNVPATEISNLVAQITFPAYSKISHDLPKLKESYFRVLQLVAFIAFPVSGMIFMVSRDFTQLFLGNQWIPMVAALQVLTVWGAVRSVATTATQVFLAVGNPGISTKMRLVELFLIACLIYPLTLRWGIAGTALAVVLGTIFPAAWTCWIAVRSVNGEKTAFGRLLLLPAINTGFMIAVVYLVLDGRPGMILFASKIILGLGLYATVTYVFKRIFNYDVLYVYRLIKESRNAGK